MRLLKWAIFFAISFVISWILITTFSQWQFQTGAPIRVVTYQTREFPLYYYPIGTFAIGLLIGLGMAVYNYVTLQARLRGKNKQTKKLEEQVARLRGEMDATVSQVKEAEAQREDARRVAAASAQPVMEHEDEFLDRDEGIGQKPHRSPGDDEQPEAGR